jgi:hypothetical protein
MPQAIVYLDDGLNKKIEEVSKELRISKHDLIIKILKEYKFEEKKK